MHLYIIYRKSRPTLSYQAAPGFYLVFKWLPIRKSHISTTGNTLIILIFNLHFLIVPTIYEGLCGVYSTSKGVVHIPTCNIHGVVCPLCTLPAVVSPFCTEYSNGLPLYLCGGLSPNSLLSSDSDIPFYIKLNYPLTRPIGLIRTPFSPI